MVSLPSVRSMSTLRTSVAGVPLLPAVGGSVGGPARSQVERVERAGIQTSAIRYYESEGLLPAPERLNGRRKYDATVLQRLALIQLLRQAGFHISDLRTLLLEFPAHTPPSARWQRVADEKIEEVDALILQMQTLKLWLTEAQKCQCATIEDCAAIIPSSANTPIQVSLACAD